MRPWREPRRMEQPGLFIHVTTGPAWCHGCQTTVPAGHLVVCELPTGRIMRCADCAPREVV